MLDQYFHLIFLHVQYKPSKGFSAFISMYSRLIRWHLVQSGRWPKNEFHTLDLNNNNNKKGFFYTLLKVCRSKTLLKYLGLSLNCRHSTQHSVTLAEEPLLNELQQRAQLNEMQVLVSEETRMHRTAKRFACIWRAISCSKHIYT